MKLIRSIFLKEGIDFDTQIKMRELYIRGAERDKDNLNMFNGFLYKFDLNDYPEVNLTEKFISDLESWLISFPEPQQFSMKDLPKAVDKNE